MKFMICLVPLMILAVAVAAKDGACPDLYKRFSSKHTFCLLPNETCNITKRGVTDEDKHIILKLHNNYRSKLATGQERNAGGMPPAANMLEMIWDDELARIAQKLTETCKIEHDCNRCRMIQAFSVGQSLGQVSNLSNLQETADWRNFIKSMYDEVSRFNKIYIKPYFLGPDTGKSQYGRFTQIVWAASWKIGCGWTLYKDGDTFTSYTACNYGPSGNIKDGEIYQVGKACSACPKNSCCGDSCKRYSVVTKYPGLCKVIIPFMLPNGPGPHEEGFIFYCDFNNQPDCSVVFEGKQWTMVRTAGGNWMSIILNAGDETKLRFKRNFTTTHEFCIKLSIRSGPNVDGQDERGQGTNTFTTGESSRQMNLDFGGLSKELRHNFMPIFYELDVLKKSDVQFSFSYRVPSGAPAQFVELSEVSVKDGLCPSSNQI